MIVPVNTAKQFAALPADYHLRKHMITAETVLSPIRADLYKPAAHKFVLHTHKNLFRNNCFVVVLNVVLRHYSVVLYAPFGKIIHCVGLLKKRIAHILFVAQYLCYRACVPTRIPRAGEYSVTLQPGGYLVGTVTVKVLTENPSHHIRLLRVDHKSAVLVFGVAQKTAVINLHLSPLIAELQTQFHILTKRLRFLLCQRSHYRIDSGANGISKYLEDHGIHKIIRQNGKTPLFNASFIRMILKNPVYSGKIAYGRRKMEKIHGTRNDYHLVEQDNYLLVDGLHEPIVSEELWQEAQVKLLAQSKKYEHINKSKDAKTHLLSGIVKCPICGAGMYGNKSIKHKKDGTKYKDFYYYGCKHRKVDRGYKCDYKKQINEELLDDSVAEIISRLVSNPKFATMTQKKINMQVDTTAIEQELENYESKLRQSYAVKAKIIEGMDTLDPYDKHYIKCKADLDNRLYNMYDKIEEIENQLISAIAKKQAIQDEKLTSDNIIFCTDSL